MIPWMKALAVSILAIFIPIKPMLITVGVLVGADMIFGILAAKKQNVPITSAGMRRTISKSVIYLSAVCLGFLCEHYLIDELIPVSKLLAGTIGMVEMKSILESADILNGGSLFASIIRKLGSQNDKLSGDK